MTSIKQIEANRRNARKSTGPATEQGKLRSRCNAVRHGLTAETVVDALEDADDYRSFEAAIIADYDARSAIERELVLRLASLLWRLRRATIIETGLFDIQADHLCAFQQIRGLDPRNFVHATFGSVDYKDQKSSRPDDECDNSQSSELAAHEPAVTLAHCFLRLANLPSYALDRLSRYEATIWRQAGQILFALQALERRKPGERQSRFEIINRRRGRPIDGCDD